MPDRLQFDAFGMISKRSLQQFDHEFFRQHIRLVLPNNAFFPGRADSEQAMAELIFTQVARYAGVAHWPVEVVPLHLYLQVGQERIGIGSQGHNYRIDL